MGTHSHRLFVTAALITAAVLPAAASAQAALAPIRVTDTQLRADRLDAEAAGIEMTSDRGQLQRAARLHESAARMRGAEDSKGAVSLYAAATDRYFAGDKAGARDLMRQSAERASAIGDVLTAARSFVDAARIASELGEARDARFYVERAKLLCNSPMLSEAQRNELRAEIGQTAIASEVVASIAR